MAQAQADQVENLEGQQEDEQPQDQEFGEGESTDGGEEEGEPDEGESDGAGEGEGEQLEEGDDDEVVVSIGDEHPPEEQPKSAADWVRDLRKSYKETSQRNRELERELAALKAKPAATEEPAQLGERPKVADFDFDEDNPEYKAALDKWYAAKAAQAERESKKQAEGIEQQKAWQAEMDRYGKAKGELKVRDFDEAEAKFAEIFTGPQQSMLVEACTNPAMVVYALGKNPAKAKELASIKSPAKMIAAVAKLEDKMKVTPRKAQTLPETPVKGSAPVSGTIDSTLERLRAEARRTGDYSKVSAHTRQAQEKAKKRA